MDVERRREGSRRERDRTIVLGVSLARVVEAGPATGVCAGKVEVPVPRLALSGGAAVEEAVADVDAPPPNTDAPGVAVNENNGLSLAPSLIPLPELAALSAEKVNSADLPLVSSFPPSSPVARFLLFSSMAGVAGREVRADGSSEAVDGGVEPNTNEKPDLPFCSPSLDFASAAPTLTLLSPIAVGGPKKGAEVEVESPAVDVEVGAAVGAVAEEKKKSGILFAFASTSFPFSVSSFAG